MANYINKYSDLAAYNADETKEFPNVSYLETEDEVKWQATEPIDQEHIVAKYNVTDTSNPTKILGSKTNITYMIVDGVQQQSVTTGYTFSTTGEHKVKYKVNSNWDGQSAFDSCSNLTNVTIPDTITTIGINAFINCYNLVSIAIPSSVTRIKGNAFYSCSGLTSFDIPSGVIEIGNGALRNCFSLTGNIIIPSGVTSIGQNAFYGCSGLTSIIIGSGVTTIGDSAFYQCTGLLSIDIPSGVTSIGNNGFSNCSSLTSITVNATTPPTLPGPIFTNTNNSPIYVPSESVNVYKTTSGWWSNYASRIQPIQ